jgi:hypothetical protein
MTDQQGIGAGSGAGSGSSSQGAGAGAGSVNAAQGAAAAPQDRRGIPENPRSRGFSPARDAREGQQRQASSGDGSGTGDQATQGQQGQGQGDSSGTPQTVKIGDAEYSFDQVNDALKFKSENDIRKSSLPAVPEGYKIELPADFQAPHGVKFEFDQNSAELQNFRKLAHARGLDQQTFSEALGIYAANRIGEHQMLGDARTAEMTKLGSAAANRIGAVEVWLKSQVGAKANLIVAQLKNFPVAGMVEMFEQLARNASSQGGADFSQSGRHQEDNTGKIPNYENRLPQTFGNVRRCYALGKLAGNLT